MEARSQSRSEIDAEAAELCRRRFTAPQEVIITAQRELKDPHSFAVRAAEDLGRSLSLAPTLFAMQLRSRRRASLLGWLWLVLPTLATMFIALVLQRQSVPLPRTQMPYVAFATIGIAVWQCAAEALNMPLRQLSAHRFAITRLNMPVEAPIFAGLIEVALNSAIRSALLLLILLLLGVPPAPTVVGLPLALAALILLAVAIGALAAPVGMVVEDVSRGLAIIAALWMIATPVLYPVPDAVSAWNPAAPLVDSARGSLTGGEFAGTAALPMVFVSLAALFVSWIWLRLARPYLIDQVA